CVAHKPDPDTERRKGSATDGPELRGKTHRTGHVACHLTNSIRGTRRVPAKTENPGSPRADSVSGGNALRHDPSRPMRRPVVPRLTMEPFSLFLLCSPIDASTKREQNENIREPRRRP